MLLCIIKQIRSMFPRSGESYAKKYCKKIKVNAKCKARGKYSKANTVHHVNHLKEHPELALERFYQDDEGNKKRNLISLCHGCHEEVHGYRQKPKEYLIEERW